jgi:hypothetical protein
MILAGVIHSVSAFLSNDHIDWLTKFEFDWVCSFVNLFSQYGIGLNIWVLVLLFNMKDYIQSFRISNSYIVEAITRKKLKWKVYQFFVTKILRKGTTNHLDQLYFTSLGIDVPTELDTEGLELKSSNPTERAEHQDQKVKYRVKRNKISTGTRSSGLEVNQALLTVTESIYNNKIRRENRNKIRGFIPDTFYKDEAKNFNRIFNSVIILPSVAILAVCALSFLQNSSVVTVVDERTVCVTSDLIKGCIFLWIITEIALLFGVNNIIWEYGNMDEFEDYMPIQYVLWNGIIVVCLQACINFGGLLPHPIWRSVSTGSIIWLHSFCLWYVIGFKIWKAIMNDIDYCIRYSSSHAWVNRVPITDVYVTEQERQQFVDFCEIWASTTSDPNESEHLSNFVTQLRALYAMEGSNIKYEEAEIIMNSFKTTLFESYEWDYLGQSNDTSHSVISEINNTSSLKKMLLDYLDSKYGLVYHTTLSVLGIERGNRTNLGGSNRPYSMLTSSVIY